VLVGKGCRDRVNEIRAHDDVFGVAAVDVVSSEARLLTQVFGIPDAVGTDAVGGVKPWDSDTLANTHVRAVRAHGVNVPDHLVTRDERELWKRQITFHDMEVSPANRTTTHAHADFPRTRNWIRHFGEAQRVLIDGFGRVEEQGAHSGILIFCTYKRVTSL
jgi:hypothetical protein